MQTIRQILEGALKRVIEEHGIQINSIDIKWVNESTVEGSTTLIHPMR